MTQPAQNADYSPTHALQNHEDGACQEKDPITTKTGDIAKNHLPTKPSSSNPMKNVQVELAEYEKARLTGTLEKNGEHYIALSNDTYWKLTLFEPRKPGWFEWFFGIEIVASDCLIPIKRWSVSDHIEILNKAAYLKEFAIDEANAANQNALTTCPALFYNCNKNSVAFGQLVQKEWFMKEFNSLTVKLADQDGMKTGYSEGKKVGELEVEKEWNQLAVERATLYEKNYKIGHEKGFSEGKKSGTFDAKKANQQKFEARLQKEKTAGYTAGFNIGYSEGLQWKETVDPQKRQAQMQAAYDEGYNKGKLKGYHNGEEKKRAELFDEGYRHGYENGKMIGYKQGLADEKENIKKQGIAQGVIDGKKAGKAAGKNDARKQEKSIFKIAREEGYREGWQKTYQKSYQKTKNAILHKSKQIGIEEGKTAGRAQGKADAKGHYQKERAEGEQPEGRAEGEQPEGRAEGEQPEGKQEGTQLL